MKTKNDPSYRVRTVRLQIKNGELHVKRKDLSVRLEIVNEAGKLQIVIPSYLKG